MTFRQQYLDYAALTTQLKTWAETYPSIFQLRSLAKSEEGRELWLAVIGPEPDRERPTAWVDGNMHANEVAGSSVCLAICEDLLRIHRGENVHGLPAHVLETLREVRFFVLPRMSPDGAETVLESGRYVRSVPRDRRPDRHRARWISGDVDGDGLALLMRQEDPTGEMVESREVKNLLVPRKLEDAGPFYKLYPEGTIEGFDGAHVPTPVFLSDNETDLNRNFPYSWAPEPDQVGAGSYPGSEPESRAVIELATRTPTIFAWLNLHTFGGVFIRPLGDKADNKMDQEDLALFRQLAAWGDELTHYPTVSGFEEFLYEPDKPLRGDLTDFAYHQRGCVALALELWDLFQQVGFARKKPFADHYTHLSREDLEKIGRWDIEHNQTRAIRPWKKLRHPQIGEVEVGGLDPRIGIWNPPHDKLGEVCERISAYMLRMAALAPRPAIAAVAVERVGPGVSRVDVTIENRGYLATYGLHSAKGLPWNEPLHVSAQSRDASLVVEGDALREIGHLDGWGRGLYDGTGALYYARTRGTTGRRKLSIVVRGRGSLILRAGSCRVGWVEREVPLLGE